MLRIFIASSFLLAFGAPSTTLAQGSSIESETGRVAVETFAEGLEHPWGATYLPEGALLVTERPGRLRLVSTDGAVSDPIDGVPDVLASGQGGLLDVGLDPDFANNRTVYLAYSEERGGGAATSVGRGRLDENGSALSNFEVIFRQEPAVSSRLHYGSRLVFAPDGKLFVTLGERGKMREAQDPNNHLGTIVRINPDGSVPDDNPFVGKDGADEIWSYGHRNVQSAALHPETGVLWTAEMGPLGGDELNIPQAGRNHGWPVVSWGRHYSGERIPEPSTRPELADSIHSWTPVISPSGMTFYTGDMFADWRGDLLIGGLSAEGIVRVRIDGKQVAGEEVLALGRRIRDVVQAPDGAVMALTDEPAGKILRLTPAASQ
ncbi:MAG: PQQ-dependent sugar dehydrogenase [Mesorhizobium sp.]|uniref:PQQ-dependent sugar dehydrogenase n=1 Tax=Mesorhizobium sp. TaxID=1871066 RepID=UPI000FE52411|nr:PQQ-dependent sugar dehydrogenase [Mesorhizobium sp.]RWB02113.1 MAG: PQQ-dependent sugar dehydrogenase [Mesorhizobium sp.]RWO06989.1 MAG: PQQ-dependent sugar dehydrogenase [Mesorhizobium sp.]TJV46882.1 MAG: PQQ-dependent sugar dehydrogenase [Mesorhizobium sp.]